MMTIVLSSVLSAVVCLGIYILVTKYVTKKSIKALREAARKEAEAEGEMIKKEKISYWNMGLILMIRWQVEYLKKRLLQALEM